MTSHQYFMHSIPYLFPLVFKTFDVYNSIFFLKRLQRYALAVSYADRVSS